MLSVQTNLGANTALKNINTNSVNMNKSLERLSSGFRINNAADDAAGFAVSSKLDAQSQRLKAASLNASQAQAMVKMADAGVNEIQNMVSRIQTLATQAASSNNAGELGKLDAERVKLESAIDKIANSTNFNGTSLLNGTGGLASTVTSTGVTAISMNSGSTTDSYTLTSAAATTAGLKFTITDTTTGAISTIDNVAIPAAGKTANVTVGNFSITIDSTAAATAAAAITNTGTLAAFQVGADNNANNQVSVDLGKSYTTTSLGLGAAGALNTAAGAQAYIDTAKNAMDTLITQRADLGATQNQVAFIQANLATSIEQTTASVSSIRDADMATEMADFTKNKILTQASTSMLAQANQAAQNVLSLFR